ERDLVLVLVVARLLAPSSKLSTTRWWTTTSLPDLFELGEVTEDDLYHAMDWLLARQNRIEKKLANKHLSVGGLVLYDLSSTWLEGETCPLAARGYSRDKKKDKLQINFGLLTDEDGRPVSVSVYKGNTADPATVQDQVKKIKEDYGIDLVVFVGDRGMVTQTQIDQFIDQGGVEWITALKSGSIRKLKTEGRLQLGLFDDKGLFEFKSKHYPDERLVACRNPELAKRRANKRRSLIDATKAELDKIQNSVRKGRLAGKAEIGLRVGRVINKYKVAKHFKLAIEAERFTYRVRRDRVDAESALDGIYIIRTSVPEDVFSAEDTVRHYKRLTRVEKSFRAMKTVDLMVRPIFHRTEDRVRAHIFLCMLAYYVEWHLRSAWKSLLFGNETETLDTRDPVARAEPPPGARRKATRKKTDDGLTVHSFQSLLDQLGTIVTNHCRRPGADDGETFPMTTQPDALQTRALELLKTL
ncbi:MAG: IS1634 family transposase, partial [bacterium]|nr:IS1634 family transposase [bacterium]